MIIMSKLIKSFNSSILLEQRMSVNLSSQQNCQKQLNQSTFALTMSSISFQQSQRNYEYDQQFTLNPLGSDRESKKLSHCLAFQVAKTFPIRIREQVTKMVQYYEDSLSNQTKDYHRLVEENNKLRKENNKYRAINLSNELKEVISSGSNENNFLFKKIKVQKNMNEDIQLIKNQLISRVSELQNLVLKKDHKINELNSEISDLMVKLRRYKKQNK